MTSTIDAAVRGPEIHRRDLLLVAGTTVALVLDAGTMEGKSANRCARDARTHFALRFLKLAEKAEGHPFPLSPLGKSKRP